MKATIGQAGADVLVLAAQCSHAGDMIGTCVTLLDERDLSVEDRRLALEVLVDAREALYLGKSALVDRGANVRAATAAILGLAWPVKP